MNQKRNGESKGRVKGEGTRKERRKKNVKVGGFEKANLLVLVLVVRGLLLGGNVLDGVLERGEGGLGLGLVGNGALLLLLDEDGASRRDGGGLDLLNDGGKTLTGSLLKER